MAKHRSATGENPCPCGGDSYTTCCGRYLDGGETPASAEQLMRSRYTAFVREREDYLLATWHPDKRPSRVSMDPDQHWIGLSIKATEAGGAEDCEGIVEFVARYKINGRGHRLHERSRFEKRDGLWFYVAGEHL